ncbi:MAG: uridine diphosphate-N-acetylglucosamine-binding protein YvcK [Candidatus Nealsonbacteria bacterium]|nr:uridine diphosphate-N-acetylglucosamine-binding protein YvcK [Candidatus Nealsonbacteria bacterium]
MSNQKKQRGELPQEITNLPKIVCMGGGNAMPKAVLTGLKKHEVRISVICAMLDSGGSSGRLREDYQIVSPGDIRRAFIALANTSPVVENLFNYRFETGELEGHNFANLFITALELSTNNNYEQVCGEISRLLNIKHEVLPVTLDNSRLYAKLENGKVITGETNIDIPKHNGSIGIEDVFLKPAAQAYPKAIDAIRDAELVVIGPGDLYSSLAQILLVKDIPKTINNSQAKKVYICNLMTKHGETNDFTVLDFTREIEKRLQNPVDYVIYNESIPSEERLSLNKKMHPELIDMVKPGASLSPEEKFIGADLITSDGEIVHDPKKLTKVILSLI